MSTSYPIQKLVAAVALQFCAAISFAQSTGVTCQTEFDGIKWSLDDGLDDLKLGPMTSSLTRGCTADSAWPEGVYTVAATNGNLRVARTFGDDSFRSLTVKDENAGIVFSGFPSDANSFWLLVHGADKEGNYVPDVRMHLEVTAVDGTVLWSKYFKVNGYPYTLGLSGISPLSTVTVKRTPTQPNGVNDSYPVIDVFSIGYDSSFGPGSGLKTQRIMGAN